MVAHRYLCYDVAPSSFYASQIKPNSSLFALIGAPDLKGKRRYLSPVDARLLVASFPFSFKSGEVYDLPIPFVGDCPFGISLGST